MAVLVRSAYGIPLFAVKVDDTDEEELGVLTSPAGCLAARYAVSRGAIVTRRAAELCDLPVEGVECGDAEALGYMAVAEYGDPVVIVYDAP